MVQFLDKLGEQGVADAVLNVSQKFSAYTEHVAYLAATARTWALAQMSTPKSGQLTRALVRHYEQSVRHAALHAVSLERDAQAMPEILAALSNDTPAIQRVAAEALGRIGDAKAVPHLLQAAARADDRVLQHSVIYALIEIGAPASTRAGLTGEHARTRCAALVALDQMPGGGLKASDVIPLLSAEEEELRRTAQWLVQRRPEWGGEAAEWLSQELAAVGSNAANAADRDLQALESMLAPLASHEAIQALVATNVGQQNRAVEVRRLALRVMARARLESAPPAWLGAIADVLSEGNADLLPLAVETAGALPPKSRAKLSHALLKVAESQDASAVVRTTALALAVDGVRELGDGQFSLLLEGLAEEGSVARRSAAADALARAPLSAAQLDRLGDAIKTVGPLELNRVVAVFEHSTDDALGMKVVASLKEADALPSLRVDVLRQSLAKYGGAVQQEVDALESLINVDAAAQRQRIADLLPQMATGDVRRGHAVFYSAKAACSACHRLGYAGGTVGPELTRIGETRTERDLLESILFPSLSFVRSYEPVVVYTSDGRALNGAVQNDTDEEIVLATGPNESVRLRREDVEEVRPGTVSVMPAGLDKQLSVEELADLVAFLKRGANN
jgi:putative heme-binding domain-containing protein